MLEASTVGRTIALRGAVAILVACCALYLGDTLIARGRMTFQRASALGDVTVYYSTALKNNKIVIFGGQPDTITCIHSLFPHFGYPACRSVANKTIDIE
jgi:hypothetical protein